MHVVLISTFLISLLKHFFDARVCMVSCIPKLKDIVLIVKTGQGKNILGNKLLD